ncbi:DMT family transporter [Xylanibacter ruminicola]|uniref:Permease of the drug/metabolite transporter (DMT) superfamily n=1 Tax=Xylanibacter ruminicola TaxID=839 RepID=A0A1M6RT73_XYLRU|nr:DMT family transporter [Xylanibacter ruminicola]SHK35497.1 Permease of the drug/metabolite transporter (DMT) superfamily [Xylanibacter ruminicola]
MNVASKIRNNASATLGYHFVAFLIVAIWGSTFVFTKILLQNGLSPAQIFTLRFIIAYLLMVIGSLASGKKFVLFSDSLRDEFIMLMLGITGGSLYFLTENASMLYTTATNTSLIVCTCPLFAILLVAVVYRHSEHISKIQALGSIIACLGMAVVVLNGHFVLHLSPIGDMLALGACLCWAVYSLLMKPASQRYSTLFITRKVFFYGLVTIIPYYIIEPGFPPMEVLLRTEVVVNLLFLGIVASMLCFVLWNWVIAKLGTVAATNWVYFNPITTIIFAWWLLNEQITVWFMLGSLLIISGMILSDKK